MKLTKWKWILLLIAIAAIIVAVFQLKIADGKTIFEWVQDELKGEDKEVD